MKEPHRLLNQSATDAEKSLLRSASADGPPDGAVERMMATLDGMAAGGPNPRGPGPGFGNGLSKAPMAAQSFRLATLAKTALLVLLGGAVTGVVVHGLAGTRQDHVERGAVTAPALQTEPALGSTNALGAPKEVLLAAKPATEAPDQPESAPRGQHNEASDGTLIAELRLLDAARAALDARNPAEARRALDSHAQQFPQGHLKPEAAVLRLAVLVRQGDRVSAKSLGQELLASALYKTYAPRIRSLLREIGESR
jgi:hypothetical protein